MSYVHPQLVISPKGKIDDLVVVYDGGEGSWSLAKMKWEGNQVMGMRWNGGSADGAPSIGNPQSRGVPTWFVLPDDVGAAIESMLRLSDRITAKP